MAIVPTALCVSNEGCHGKKTSPKHGISTVLLVDMDISMDNAQRANLFSFVQLSYSFFFCPEIIRTFFIHFERTLNKNVVYLFEGKRMLKSHCFPLKTMNSIEKNRKNSLYPMNLSNEYFYIL